MRKTCLALGLFFLLPLAACANSGQQTIAVAPEPAATVAPESKPQAEAPVAAAPAPATSLAKTTVATPPEATEWGAVFVAGDHSIKAFDNATRRFYAIIERKPGVTLRRLTSDPSIAPAPEDVADVDTIDSALSYVTKNKRENCLVFMTSHGTTEGFYLSQANGAGGLLPPRVLDQWLDNHCGMRPTVVIVSACFSGIFLTDGMEQPNRIILTAARSDRPSFGCGAGETYTYYDKCLLDSWTWVYTWQELYDRTKVCVIEREAEMDANPSEPQAYFGAEVATLEMP